MQNTKIENNTNTKKDRVVKKDAITNLDWFVSSYTKQANESLQKKFLDNNLKLITDYVPFSKKLALVDNILTSSMHEGEVTETGDFVAGDFKVNSAITYLLYVITLIDTYTNIVVDYINMDNMYDALNKAGLIEKIIGIIPDGEIMEFKTMLDMRKNDMFTNEYEIHGYINRLFDRAKDVISVVTSGLSSALSDLESNGIDLKEIVNNLITQEQ